jgi:hypothetical protein
MPLNGVPMDPKNLTDLIQDSKGAFENLVLNVFDNYGLDFRSSLDPEMMSYRYRLSENLGRMNAELIGERQLGFVAELIELPWLYLREAGVHCLTMFATKEKYDLAIRKRSGELLKKVLLHENDPLIRAYAVQPFEQGQLNFLGAIADQICSWWSDKTEEAKKRTILLSDDERNFLEALQRLLGRQGFKHVVCEKDSVQLIDLAKKIRPSVIVTDLIKPRMNGIEMAKSIKAIPSLASVPILLFSGSVTFFLDQLPEGLFCGILLKGIHFQLLPGTIVSILGGNLEE